jgi:hypothetical protein
MPAGNCIMDTSIEEIQVKAAAKNEASVRLKRFKEGWCILF